MKVDDIWYAQGFGTVCYTTLLSVPLDSGRETTKGKKGNPKMKREETRPRGNKTREKLHTSPRGKKGQRLNL